MYKFIEDLLVEVATVTPEDIAEGMKTLEEPKAGQEYIGTLSDDLQRIFALVVKLNKELEAEKMKVIDNLALAFLNNKTTDEILAKGNALHPKIKDITKFFWLELKTELGVNDESIGIKKDWKAYYLDPVCPGCMRRHPTKEDLLATEGEEASIAEVLVMLGR